MPRHQQYEKARRGQVGHHQYEAKRDMERAGVSTTSDGNMTSKEISDLKKRVSDKLKPLSRELGQMLDGQR